MKHLNCIMTPMARALNGLPAVNKPGGMMKMKFTLNMENLNINGNPIDIFILDWIDEVSQDQVMEMSQQWITSQTFLTERMVGLHKVGESSLTIEPVGE
jgi:hypothetical protein